MFASQLGVWWNLKWLCQSDPRVKMPVELEVLKIGPYTLHQIWRVEDVMCIKWSGALCLVGLEDHAPCLYQCHRADSIPRCKHSCTEPGWSPERHMCTLIPSALLMMVIISKEVITQTFMEASDQCADWKKRETEKLSEDMPVISCSTNVALTYDMAF